jgi:magnesium chelatase family protein
MDTHQMRRWVKLDEPAQAALSAAYAKGVLSARGRHRVLRVARTVADLDGRQQVTLSDLMLALGMRQRTGSDQAVAA